MTNDQDDYQPKKDYRFLAGLFAGISFLLMLGLASSFIIQDPNGNELFFADANNYTYNQGLDQFVPVQEFGGGDTTVFDEQMTAEYTNRFNIKPTWGTSILRDLVIKNGTGSGKGASEGEIYINSGVDAGGFTSLESVRRGQYLLGTVAEVGIGMRLPEEPVGDQVIEWGYFNDKNGFGFCKDAVDECVFYERNGTTNVVYQDNWNVDPLDGTGPSGLNLSVAEGYVYEISFVYYGYGDIEYYVNIPPGDGQRQKRVLVHIQDVPNQTSVFDSNLPIQVRVSNGGTSGDNLRAYVGGRQFSTLGGEVKPNDRPVAENLCEYTLDGAQGSWEPLIGARLKPTFGPNNYSNSVRVKLSSYSVSTTSGITIRPYVGRDLVTSTGWERVRRYPENETAIETQLINETLTANRTGYPLQPKNFVTSTASNPNQARQIISSEAVGIPLGLANEVVFWAKKNTADDVPVCLEVSFLEER